LTANTQNSKRPTRGGANPRATGQRPDLVNYAPCGEGNIPAISLMKKGQKKEGSTMIRKLAAVTFSLLLVCISFAPAFAASEKDSFSPVSLNIEGRHIVENNETLKDGRHTFVLTAKDGAPMPEGSEKGVKKVTINSNEAFDFGEMTFNRQGIYEYSVTREIIESDTLKMDDSEYTCNIAVFADGTYAMVFGEKGVEGKPNKIEYTDTYHEPEPIPEPEDEESTPVKKVVKKIQTGENMSVIIYACAGAAAALAAVFLLRKKKKDE